MVAFAALTDHRLSRCNPSGVSATMEMFREVMECPSVGVQTVSTPEDSEGTAVGGCRMGKALKAQKGENAQKADA